MSDKLRVHILSKELGVTSKAIIAKCKNESVEGITNHMSTVSAGLAETIREWFSEGAHRTAIETTEPVDLKTVRVKKRTTTRRKKKTEEERAKEAVAVAIPQEKEVEILVAETKPVEAVEPEKKKEKVAKAPSKKPPVKKEKVTKGKKKKPLTMPEVVEPVGPVVVAEVSGGEPPPESPAPAVQKEKKVVQPAAKAPEPIPPPPQVGPAGPQNIPAPAQMKGPRVVGFAKPDPIVRPPRAPGLMPPVPMEPPDLELPPYLHRGGKGKGSHRVDHWGKRSRHRANPRRSGASVTDVGERIKEWNDRDLLERQERLKAASGRGIHTRRAREKKTAAAPVRIAPRKTKAQVAEPIIVRELCAATGIGMSQLWPKFKNDHNMLIALNTVLPTDVAELVMLDFGVELEIVKPKSSLEELVEELTAQERKNLQPRPPVVTMLGHVDHGKTSLLDAIRKTSVTEGEAGGITQHIGAYCVERGDLSVTFLDTPGHEAFTAMRARGANMTDVVVLVIAADDGVMPQTVEAINHAKAANVTIVVALNKIDLPGVDINKVYGRLSELDLTPTEWGGSIDVVKTSAVTGEGVEKLITHLATLSDLLDLKADPTVSATGTVVEAEMHSSVGPLARVLVREGTLRSGDFIICGPGAGRVRMMRDDRGRRIKEAGPGIPVEIAGLDTAPNAGDNFYRLESLQRAKQIAEDIKDQRRAEILAKSQKAPTLEDLLRQRERGAVPELNLILRADVQGSVDALINALEELSGQEVKIDFLHTGIGSVTEGDVVLAEASGALIVGFNVTAEPGAQRLADSKGIDVHFYRVIYDVLDDIRGALEGLLPTDKKEEFRGKAEIREIFHVSRVGVVAGCMVTEGLIGRAHFVRVVRDGQIIIPTEDDVKSQRHRGVGSLRRFKDDAREVRAGMECGIRIENFDDLKPGDVIETYEIIETARKL